MLFLIPMSMHMTRVATIPPLNTVQLTLTYI